VGTDVSRRSLDFSAANAELNGVENLELREGDWFAPVAGERFDLVVTNLPYVISPDIELVHRDNPFERDELARRIVAEVPAHLTDGGLAHVLCNWVHRAEDDPSEVPRAWAKGLGCDTLVLQYSSHEPLAYAASWNRPLQARDPAAFEQTVDRWLAYYRETGIERIALGTIVLRKRSAGRPWFRAIEVQDAPSGLAGAQTDRLLAAQDHLLGLKGEDDLLRRTFRPVEGQRVEQRLVHRAGRYAAEAASLRLVPGIGVRARVDPRAVEVVMACDGSRPLGKLIAAATAGLGEEGPAVAAMCLATVRGLFELGLVTAGRGR
jgi:methylase of polypeptide subunit release factors